VFEQQYDEEMAAEIKRLEAKQRAARAGHSEWDNACAGCGCQLDGMDQYCSACSCKGAVPQARN
jgi:hypothetical protein